MVEVKYAKKTKGYVYMMGMVGRWGVAEADMQTIGVLRHGTLLAVFLSVLDVRDDLRRVSQRG